MPRSGSNDFEKWDKGPTDAELEAQHNLRMERWKAEGQADAAGCFLNFVVAALVIVSTVLIVLALMGKIG